MAPEDIQAFAVFGFIAALIGLAVAFFARRSSSPYHVTSVCSFGIAMIGGPVVFGIAEAIYRAATDGISFTHALEVIVSVAFVFFFAAPISFGLPAVLAGCAFQWLFQRAEAGRS